MARVFYRRLLLSLLTAALLDARPLLLISIDGMDHRYLRDRDAMGLKIPNLRKLLADAAWADGGVIGVMPTVTFPSHTTMVTGVQPHIHGILNNNQAETGQRYWSVDLLKAPTLWDAAKKAGKKVGAVHWPVTVDAKIDWNFPEYFQRRLGHGMDWDSTEQKSTPGLIAKMTARYPSMPQEWVDDRVRALATIYLLKYEKPDLILLHLVDHDGEAHDTGPFTKHAKAVLERTDELLGEILAATPKDWAVAIVSDHGFEHVKRPIDVGAVTSQAAVSGPLVTTSDPTVAAALRKAAIGREIPASEWKRVLPHRPVPLAAFEPPEGGTFVAKMAGSFKPRGDHGYWPLRRDYHSTFLLTGKGVKRASLGEIEMTSIAARLAAVLEIPFGKDK
ncbi:MAG: alkaline phosphatase family protein [Acidobacteria bacterium]|nr:alkaline phosphatase family protein [Acidobacteriota bacterium]